MGLGQSVLSEAQFEATCDAGHGECDTCHRDYDLYSIIEDPEPDANWCLCLKCIKRRLENLKG